MKIFKTHRLLIRNLKNVDLDSFYDMQRNPNVMQYIKNTMNYEESKKELKRFIGYYHNETKFFKIWAIINPLDNSFIGICGVYENEKSEFEIAYRLRECFWGKGYGLEVAKGLITYCFEKTNITELFAYVHSNNIGSIRILEKEMNFEKEFYSEKCKCFEKIYKLRKENWLLQ